MSDSQEVLNILVRAMINEQDGYEFYLSAKEQVHDAKGQRMLQGLADDEADHLRIIRAQYDRVTEGKVFVDLATARRTMPADPSLKLFPDKSQLPSMLSQASDDVQALRVALDFELKGYRMYQQAAQKTTDPNARTVFGYLTEQEDRHYKWIQQTLHYLEQNGVWFFQDEEKPIFDG